MLSALPRLEDAAEQIRAGRLSPVELVDFCLSRIARHEDQVRAWVFVDEAGARRAAEECANEIAGGRWRGPLHGIPLGVKDIFDVAGQPTLAGSPLRAGHRAERDAPLVARLRECGAIVLGKTVTTEFASFDPPVTRNPWNLDRTPGGSSSGSAAALAAGMCALALGSQTGGSITRPAAYCGVAGLKPRYGALPLSGVLPLAWHLDHPGPLARSAADLRLFWRACHETPGESGSPRPDPAARSELLERPPRLLRLDGYFRSEAAKDVRASFDEALARLADSGAEIRGLQWPEISQVHAAHRCIMAVEAATYHRETFAAERERFGPNIAALIEEGLAYSAVAYAAALVTQRDLKDQIREMALRLRADALILPAASSTAPGRESTGDPKFNSPWSFAGLAAANIPCGLTPSGMPCGIQLVGLGEELPLLDVAVWCEERLRFRAEPPL